MSRYRVYGAHPVRGRKPGQILNAELNPAEEARHLAAGRLRLVKTPARPSAKTTAPTPRTRKED